MRGVAEASGALFSLVDLEDRVPTRQPLRKIRKVVSKALASLDAEFEALRPGRAADGQSPGAGAMLCFMGHHRWRTDPG